MDELKDILWIVGAIGTIALSFVSQKRKKPAARVAGEPEAFPACDGRRRKGCGR